MDTTTTSFARDNTTPRARRAQGSAPPKRVGPTLPKTWKRGSTVGVRPAYLALGSLTSLVPAGRVLRAASWTRTDQGHVQAYARGDIQVLLHDDAEGLYQYEALTARGLDWRVTFSSQTPDEVLAAVAGSLVEVAVMAEDGAPDRADLDEAVNSLAEAGWEGAESRGGGVTRITAPDRLAEILCHRSKRAWLITAGVDGEGWEAELVGDCPDLLIEAVVGSLATESPARRRTADLPTALRRYLDIGPDPYRPDGTRRTSLAVRAASPTVPVVTPAHGVPAPARRSR
ncbi:hypothetical protein KV557_00290 [Kitasatospora aureofaciens]|uniref:hypothetical protein n=1 Tax=Kitasatospora aureofaciens TaxID=1894 RepID=UPI001C45208D|nr:hypothetical protein [Kitasatospora aureofaciens]MBV6695565.1 hypothetical protein [Kitasatospora aureofaciens]